MNDRKKHIHAIRHILCSLLVAALLLVTTGGELEARDLQLSDSAYASLITCGPGDEFYTSFGHTALRVCDSSRNIDYVFNYGCFDFGAPHFYLRFARGKLDYFVAAEPYEYFMMEYASEGRSVQEQRLLMSKEEIQRLFTALSINTQPENRTYAYDFFRDNCATRVRDMVAEAIGPQRSIDDTAIPIERNSWRSLIYKYTEGSLLWWRFGVDVLLGARCDRELATFEYAYVPMELMNQFDTLLVRPDGTHIAESPLLVLPERRVKPGRSISPTLCFWLLFALMLILTVVARRRRWKLYWLDGILYGVAGAVSLLLLFLWFGSDHYCTKWNFNLLWANPLLLWILFRLRKDNRIVSTICLVCMALLVVGWFWLPQQFNTAVLPITLTLMLRLANGRWPLEKQKTCIND